MRRREFLTTSAGAVGLSLVQVGASLGKVSVSLNDRISIAMVGVRGRGRKVLELFAARPDVEVRYVCDIDEGVLNERTVEVAERIRGNPQMIKDFRHALDDDVVDARGVKKVGRRSGPVKSVIPGIGQLGI